MTTIEDDLAPLATLDEETGKPPESRVRSASGVRQCITEMREGESIRSQRRAKIQGLLDGNPPYSKKKQRDLNRAGEANVNFRTGEGTVDAAKTPYYDLWAEVPRFLNVEVDYSDDPIQNAEWGETISNGLHNLFDEWDGMDANMQLKQWQMCVHGIGIAVFEDTLDWRWKSCPIGDVLVRDDAEANIDELDESAIPRSILPEELYRKIKNEAAAKNRGWNVPLAQQAIINAAPESFRNRNGNNWEAYQEAIRTGDISWANKSNRIQIVNHFVREFDGSITHSIVLDDNRPQRSVTVNYKEEDDFLFHKVGRFDSFRQVMCPFFFDVIGSGLWHSVKGLGPKIYDFCNLENILTCRMADLAMAGVIAVPKTAETLERLELIRAGAVTWYPVGTEFQSTKLSDSLEGPIAFKRDIAGMLQSNTGQYRQRVSGEEQEPTLGQAQLNAQQQAMLGKGAVNRYYKSLDRLYREMVRRVLNPKLSASDPGGKEAMEFREWCVARGVPEEALTMDRICRIKSVRSMGYGSPAMREVVSQKLISLLPTMPEPGRYNALRVSIAPYVGQNMVDSFYPPFAKADIPNDHVWAANVENTELRQPNPKMVITPNQDHLIHFDSHASDALQHVQELQAGQAKPMDVLMHLHNAGPHMRGHLNILAADPTRKAQLAQRELIWLQLSKVTDQLQQQIEEALKSQAANPPQPQVDPDLVAKLADVHGKLALKAQKQQGDQALKAQNQAFKQRLADLQAAHDARLKTAQALQLPPPSPTPTPVPAIPPVAPVPQQPQPATMQPDMATA